LRKAKIVSAERLPHGVTEPLRLDLEHEGVTASAVWKSVDRYKPGVTRFRDGTFEANFSDSYKFEVAAYELDKLLGLGLVPPTVVRRFRGKAGSLELFIENATTDFERRQKRIPPPDLLRWNRQIYNLQLLRQLTCDADYKNVRNNLIDPNWRVWVIDSSRAFRPDEELFEESTVDHFSRAVLERLEALGLEMLKERLGQWVSDARLEAFLARRDRLLARARKLVAERGAVSLT